MLFKGRLRLPSDPGEGIPIDLELEDVFLSLDSDGEDFGEWRLDTVEIKRLFSNQFSMLLDGEEMVFIADDALGFAYDGLSAIEDVKSRLSKRRLFKGRKPKKREVSASEEDDVDEPEADEAVPEPTRPDVPMPEVVPFFPEPSPSFADSVAESVTEDDSIAPVAPRPIEPVADAPVAERSAAPVVEPTPPAPEPAAPAPPVVQPAPEAEPAPAVDQPAADSPVAPAQQTPPVEEDEDEFVIEDVAAYGYVPNVASAVPATEETTQEDAFEIEEADVGTGAVHREVHPLGEAAAPRRAPEVHPLGDPNAHGPEPTQQPEPVAEPEPEPVAEPEPTLEPEPIPEPEPTPEPEPVAETPAPPADERQAGFGQWSSNGRAKAQPELEPEPETDRPQTQRTGRHERSSGKSRSLFGRKKSREPEEHEHRYESSKTVGGITRSVCAVCGHVSFAGEDVYQDW